MLKLIDEIPFDSEGWPGTWMWAKTPGSSLEVVQFAIRFKTDDINFPLRLHISADNRYKLYLDGDFVGLGPQKGDISNWYFDTYEFLRLDDKSEHVLSAIVWCNHYSAPTAQISVRPGFLAISDELNCKLFNSVDCWKCRCLTDYKTIAVPEEATNAGCGFDIPGFSLDELAPTDEIILKEYKPPVAISLGQPRDYRSKLYGYCPWRLAPRTIPAMKAEILQIGYCRELDQFGSNQADELKNDINTLLKLPAKPKASFDSPVTIEANKTYRFLIDHETLTKGYPIVKVSGGAGAEIRLFYQEALQKTGEDIRDKGHRDDTSDCEIIGVSDVFRPDGRNKIIFEPLWYRCWRYISVEITTAGTPLQIDSIVYRSTGYPLVFKAQLQVDDWFGRLVEPGFETLRMCAGETYLDCPYYEQLQYVGDTRLQALLSYLLAGDDRLARQAIGAFDRSRLPSGLVQARYPSRIPQFIPSFSLWYISILYDFMMWRGDIGFVADHLLGINLTLQAFKSFRRADGLLASVPGWCFIDWNSQQKWKRVVPADSPDGTSYVMNFQYLYALEHAARLFDSCGDSSYAEEIKDQAHTLRKQLQKIAFDESKQFFIDNCSTQHLSQHTNILAILTDSHIGVIDGEILLERILSDIRLVEVSSYYAFYLFEAMYHLNRADMIWPKLSQWHEMLDSGLTTFPENSGATRSDCHGWSAHPLYHYFASILGVRPVTPGCAQMYIKPLQRSKVTQSFPARLGGSLMLPQGKLHIALQDDGDDWKISAEPPAGCEVVECVCNY